MATNETHDDTSASLAERAITVARRQRAIDPRAFAHRDTIPSSWNRRAITTTHLAVALDVSVESVIVRDDPDRRYGIAASTSPGDLIEVTSDGRPWYFIPDVTGFVMWTWLLLGPCLACEAPRVPVTRVAGLASLGAHLDPEPEHHFFDTATIEFHGDPAHRTHCLYAATAPHTARDNEKESQS
ncbi:hypothetical protein BS329_03655 [Amycolatopsis coloradensis]|uniref:Uncharacterized protein n=1 Tax=Amycolatopsis coloradensis TaxID=76021 RepID=A0A1R0L001_9PSEU|nr:hypothetical protein [Amycolatopsis coloradensis]OLZ55136.1 hypothetical protein BS329_03655 [Amycolatopsis coloradensis]